jgi:YebC/PmpR family DNA-binding regulatory protein
MSGHSHWAGIKHKKQLADLQKGKVFSKLAKEIEIAARQGGDPGMNPKLRLAIEKAKEAKMPSENIERAIKRGTGELKAEKLEEVLFEAYGPGGIAILIEGITENKNRTLAEIKQILNQNGGKLVGEGAIRWMFERKGCITVNLKSQNSKVKGKEDLELIAIESGAEDLYWHDDLLDVYTKIEDLEKVKKNLEEKGIKIESASLDWVAKEEISLDQKTRQDCQKLFEALDENEAVQEIYSNLKL